MKRTDIPNSPHYAIMIIDTVSMLIPGDERSRTHPGHGYPERTETYDTIQYKSYTDCDEGKQRWETELVRLWNLERYKVVGFHVDKVAKPEVEIKINV